MPHQEDEQSAKLKKIIPDPEWTPAYWRVSQDSALSLRALGLHTHLMSLPEGWDISADRISHVRVEGRDAIRNALKELEEASLVKRTKHRKKDGTFKTTIEVFAVPQSGKSAVATTRKNDANAQVRPETENQASVNQASVNQASKKKDSRREILEKEEQLAPSSLVVAPQAASDETSDLQLFDDPQTPPADVAGSQKPKTQRQKQGSRLPEDFTVTPDMVAWARDNCPDVDGRYEEAQFKDYWLSRPGRVALKLDWVAAWRTWMRKAQKDHKASSGFSRKPAHQPFRNPVGGAAAYEGAF